MPSTRRRLTYPSQTAILRYLPILDRTPLLASIPEIRKFERRIPYDFDTVYIGRERLITKVILDTMCWTFLETDSGRVYATLPTEKVVVLASYDDIIHEMIEYFVKRPATTIKTMSFKNLFPSLPRVPEHIDRIVLTIDELVDPMPTFFSVFRRTKTVIGEVEVNNAYPFSMVFDRLRGLNVDCLVIKTVELVDMGSLLEVSASKLEIIEILVEAEQPGDFDDQPEQLEDDFEIDFEEDFEVSFEEEAAEAEQAAFLLPEPEDNDVGAPEDVEEEDRDSDRDSDRDRNEEDDDNDDDDEEEAEDPIIFDSFYIQRFLAFVEKFRASPNLRVGSTYTMDISEGKTIETSYNPGLAMKLFAMGADYKRIGDSVNCFCIEMSDEKELVIYEKLTEPGDKYGKLTVEVMRRGTAKDIVPSSVLRTVVNLCISAMATINSASLFRLSI